MLVTLPMGFCFGAMEVTLPAFAEDHGHRALAGVLVATWSFGSAVGGLAYGARSWPGSPGKRYARLAAVKKPVPKYTRGVFAKYIASVGSASPSPPAGGQGCG